MVDHSNLPTWRRILIALQILDPPELTPDVKYAGYFGKSLFLFPMTSRLRLFCIDLISNAWFDRFIMLVIFVNCIFLAAYNPLEAEDSINNQVLFVSEIVFTIIFSVEMAIKVTAMGFLLHKGAYLRDKWNWIDFIVVCSGYIAFVPGVSAGYTAIRTLRVLRPLRAISAVGGMRVMVSSLFGSIPLLIDLVGLSLFFFAVFGIMGIQLYVGALRQNCFLDSDPSTQDPTDVRKCAMMCLTSPFFCGYFCPSDSFCSQAGQNPNYGITSFDNIFSTLLLVFQVTTLEGWVDIMYMVQDAHGQLAFIYFCSMVIIGSFFILNLALAVVSSKFSAEREEEDEAKEEEEEQAEKVREEEEHRAMEIAAKPSTGSESLATSESPLIAAPGKVVSNGEARRGSKDHPMSVDLPSNSSTSYHGPAVVSTSVFVSVNPVRRRGLTDHLEEDATGEGNGNGDGEGEGEEGKVKPALVSGSLGFSVFVAWLQMSWYSFLQWIRPVLYPDSEEGRAVDAFMPPIPFYYIKLLVVSNGFQIFIIIMILLNTAFMAMYFYGIPEGFSYFLEVMNICFSCMFSGEMMLKLSGLGIRGYLKDRFNIFDGVIVLFSILELALEGSGLVTVFRTLRLFRVFKLARNWKSLQVLLNTIASALMNMFYFSFLLALFLFIYTVLGMYSFGGLFYFPTEEIAIPRANFDSLYWSFVTVFQVLSGENWNLVMYDGMRATSPLMCIYFVSLIVIGQYILFNVFVAILLDSFSVISMREMQDAKAKQLKENSTKSRIIKNIFLRSKAKSEANIDETNETNETNERRAHAVDLGVFSCPPIQEESNDRDVTLSPTPVPTKSLSHSLGSLDLIRATSPTPSEVKESSAPTSADLTPPALLGRTGSANSNGGDKAEVLPLGYSLFIFSPNNLLRRYAFDLVNSSLFEYLIIFFIFLNSVLLALDNPSVAEWSWLGVILSASDSLFTWVFTLEMLIKMFAMGVVGHRGSYLRDGWNDLDFFIVVVSLAEPVTQIMLGVNISFVRSLRALRPLRVVSRSEGMRVVVYSLFRSVKAITNVFFVSILFYIIFSILGVSLFGGLFYYCNDPAVEFEWECIGTFWLEGIERERFWRNPPYHFDNIFSSIFILFQMSTTEGWTDVMASGVDVTTYHQQPARDNSPYYGLFFVAFIVVGNFFILNLFVGVVIDNFNRLKESLDGLALLTRRQREWVDTQLAMSKVKPKRVVAMPANPIRRYLFVLTTNKAFDLFIILLIIINIGVMASRFYDQPLEWEMTLWYLNIFFSCVFLIEMIFKITAHGPVVYWQSNWNKMDAIIVTISMIGLLNNGFGATVFRIARLARIFRIVKSAKGLRTLLNTVIFSIPSLFNVASLLFLVFFIYAVMGVAMFGRVKWGYYLNVHANFTEWGIAMLTLFRMITGEGWNGIMYDCMVTEPYCDYEAHNCGSPVFAIIYFCSFTTIGSFVLLNLVIAIILENFETSSAKEEYPIKPNDFDHFAAIWSRFDPYATQYIPAQSLEEILYLVGPPLGLGPTAKQITMVRFIKSLNIPLAPGNRLHFAVTLFALSQQVAGVDLPDGVVQANIERVVRRLFPRSLITAKDLDANGEPLSGINPQYGLAEEYAARWVQKAFRNWRSRKRMMESRARMKEAAQGKIHAHMHRLFSAEGEGVSDDDDAEDEDVDASDRDNHTESLSTEGDAAKDVTSDDSFEMGKSPGSPVSNDSMPSPIVPGSINEP